MSFGRYWDGTWKCQDCGIVLPRDYRGQYHDPDARRSAAAAVLAREAAP